MPMFMLKLVSLLDFVCNLYIYVRRRRVRSSIIKMHSKFGMTTTSKTSKFVEDLQVSRPSCLKKPTKCPKVKSIVYIGKSRVGV